MTTPTDDLAPRSFFNADDLVARLKRIPLYHWSGSSEPEYQHSELPALAAARIEALESENAGLKYMLSEDEKVLRLSQIDEDGVAPDGSVWRSVRIDGVDYSIPYEVAMHMSRRTEERLALESRQRVLREELERIEDNLGDYIERKGTVDVSIALAYEVTRAALAGDAG